MDGLLAVMTAIQTKTKVRKIVPCSVVISSLPIHLPLSWKSLKVFLFSSIKKHLLFLNLGCPKALAALIGWVGMPDIKSK